jgi:hypothetical protein
VDKINYRFLSTPLPHANAEGASLNISFLCLVTLPLKREMCREQKERERNSRMPKGNKDLCFSHETFENDLDPWGNSATIYYLNPYSLFAMCVEY